MMQKEEHNTTQKAQSLQNQPVKKDISSYLKGSNGHLIVQDIINEASFNYFKIPQTNSDRNKLRNKQSIFII